MNNIKDAIDSPHEGVASEIECHRFEDDHWRHLKVSVPQEMALTLFINNQELLTILCTPTKLNCLIIGFLLSEGIIASMSELLSMRVCEEESMADVRLNKEFTQPKKRILTSGCGGGVGFTNETQKVISNLTASPNQLLSLMKQLLDRAELHHISGGVHTSILCAEETVLVTAEDVGRHNTLDKIIGECKLRNIPTKDKILLTSGRLSSEMLRKTAYMEIPIVTSLTSPTERAIALAREAGITLVGYAQGRHLSVYSCAKRLTGI